MGERRGQLTTDFDPELEDRWDRIYGETKRLNEEAEARVAAGNAPETDAGGDPPPEESIFTERDLGRNALGSQVLEGPAELSLF